MMLLLHEAPPSPPASARLIQSLRLLLADAQSCRCVFWCHLLHADQVLEDAGRLRTGGVGAEGETECKKRHPNDLNTSHTSTSTSMELRVWLIYLLVCFARSPMGEQASTCLGSLGPPCSYFMLAFCSTRHQLVAGFHRSLSALFR
jgi:hypothetical protein